MTIPQDDIVKAQDYIKNIDELIAEHGHAYACGAISQYLRYFVTLANLYNEKENA